MTRLRTCLLTTVLGLAGVMSGVVQARDWTVDQRKVKADYESFDGKQVVLITPLGRRLTVAIEKLSDADVAYVKSRVELEAAAKALGVPANPAPQNGPGNNNHPGAAVPALPNMPAANNNPGAAGPAAPNPPAPKNDPAGAALQTLVSEAQYSRYLQEQSLRQQATMFWMDWYDLWVVQMIAPNGQPFWVSTPARNSLQATMDAIGRYPAARVLWVQKVYRRH